MAVATRFISGLPDTEISAQALEHQSPYERSDQTRDHIGK